MIQWLRSLLSGRRLDREMREEMQRHVELTTERMIARGMSPEDAGRAALREFGNVHYLEEEARDVRGSRWVLGLTPDAKLALRMLVKSPLLTVVGGLGMTVAITVAIGFFTFMSFYYADPPVAEGDRVVSVEYIDGDNERSTLFDYRIWQAELRSMEALAAYRIVRYDVEGPDGVATVVGDAEMTASAFRVFRAEPLFGRALADADEIEGAPAVAVLGYREWQELFGGDRDVLGQEIELDEVTHTIIGVMPDDFRLPMNQGLWTALRTGVVLAGPDDGPTVRVFGRLADGVERAAARDEAVAIGQRLARQHPDEYERFHAVVLPYVRHIFDVQQYPPWVTWLMQLFAALILAAIAVNVAVLVYARTAMRQAEITVRTALGAGRGRIVTQLFLEALALSALAAGAALLLADFGFRQLTSFIDVQDAVPYWLLGGIPVASVLYAAGLAALAAFIVGVVPALQVTGGRLQSALRDIGGGGGMRMGKTWTTLICVQVAIAVGALPAVVGIWWHNPPPPNPTFDASGFVAFQLRTPAPPPGAPTPTVPDTSLAELQAELLRRVSEEPGVTEVTFASTMPIQGRALSIDVEGGSVAVERSARYHEVAVDYLGVLGVPMIAGRLFAPRDLEGDATAAIVSRAFVDEILGGGPALGRRFRELPVGTLPTGSEPWHEIVGVVEDMLEPARGGPSTPSTYHPVRLGSEPVTLAAITADDQTPSTLPRIREIAGAVAPDHGLWMYRMDDWYRGDQEQQRFLVLAVGLMTLAVLALSGAGISAMMSFAVTRRRREIGIRTALGATRRQLLGAIFSRAGRQLGVGLIAGILFASLLDRLTGGVILDGEAAPLLAFVAAIMLACGAVATLGPARRALGAEPMDALREE